MASESVPVLRHHGGDVPETPQFRPKWHFTPQKNWMNDPNGLVYFEGEYHLFFQYNPEGKDWGHMSWGHAVSTDLIHWTELPVAILEGEQMIFSGCAIVDWNNDSGLGDGEKPPLLAYFTAHNPRTLIQSQHLAFSHDCGRSWSHYAGNPIIDLALDHFRDPKVFYHHASAAWIMAVALPRAHRVQFYRSANLIDWTIAGEFGPAGGVGGQWECPDLIELCVEGDEAGGQSWWVLKIDIDKDFLGEGSGAQYFVGQFDGFRFTIDGDRSSADGEILDHGPDFYAAVTWSDLPSGHEGPVMIGWMSNHQSGHQYPTHPWRGVQSLPRVLSLFCEGGKLRLRQRPVSQFRTLAHDLPIRQEFTFTGPSSTAFSANAGHLSLRFADTSEAVRNITISDTESDILSVDIKPDNSFVQITRMQTKSVAIDNFAIVSRIYPVDRSIYFVDIIFDKSSVEIFFNNGEHSYSTCIFPEGPTEIKWR